MTTINRLAMLCDVTKPYDYEWFKQAILQLTNIDLSFYKEKQMKRRINTLIERNSLYDYHSFVQLLKTNDSKLQYFLNYITINVTEFFRTSEHWLYFESTILPQLNKPKVWSCACSTGQEPYSLVMSMAEIMPLDDITIIATDIDEQALKQAQSGLYSADEIKSVPQRFLDKYFTTTQNGYQISSEVKKRVEFVQMDLLKEPCPQDCDLIVCRNVLIYFTQEAKQRLFKLFYDSLKPGGVLFTGNAEQILNYKQLGFAKKEKYLYIKQS